MSLNWNLGDVPDEVCWLPKNEDGKELMNPVTEALIWRTMVIGIGKITEKNWIGVWTRIKFMQKLHGAELYRANDTGESTDWFLTDKDVHDHIGLSTNVTKESQANWLKRQFGVIADSEQRRGWSLEQSLKEEVTA